MARSGSTLATEPSARLPGTRGDPGPDEGASAPGIDDDLKRAMDELSRQARRDDDRGLDRDRDAARELDRDTARELGQSNADASKAQELPAVAPSDAASPSPPATLAPEQRSDGPGRARSSASDDAGAARELRDGRRGERGGRRVERALTERSSRASTEGAGNAARLLRRALDQALPELGATVARRAVVSPRGRQLGPRSDEVAALAHAPKAQVLDETKRGVGRRAELEAVPDAALAGPAERALSPAAGAETVLPVSQARAALFDAESFLHGAVQAESARVTVDVGGEALHLFVRVHDGATEVRASGAVPEELERSMRASLLGEGLRLEHFSSQSGQHEAPAEPELEPDAPTRRPRPAEASISGAGTAASSSTSGGKLSVRA